MGRRAEHVKRARDGEFDLVVIGGGITGAGAARDAARRGLDVCLLDAGDLATGTSSRSSKLVHGGLRYLEHGEIRLVFEAVSERRVLMDIAPHLVRPLGFVFPVYRASRKSPVIIDIGMWVYDGLSLFRSPRVHRRLSRADVAEEEPALLGDGLRSAELYYDCATDDARLTLETAMDAAAAGGTVATWCEVTGFRKDAEGRVCGVEVRDRLEGGTFPVDGRVVINATGPWTDAVRARAEGSEVPPLLRPTKGVHLVVPRERVPVRYAVVMFHPEDGRVLFAIPWGERTYLGTTDTDWEGDPAELAADAADVRYLLDATNHYFPESDLTADHVLATWAGLRPLIGEEGVSESQVSREHEIRLEESGLLTIAGGKLTTYRRMGAELVDRALRVARERDPEFRAPPAARTADEPLPGAVGWPEGAEPEQVARELGEANAGTPLSEDQLLHLTRTYGVLARDLVDAVHERPELAEPLVPGRNEILAQVHRAVHHEFAARLQDVLARRTPLYFKDADQGLTAAEPVSRAMAGWLGWSEERRQAELADYRREVALTRAWRRESPLGGEE